MYAIRSYYDALASGVFFAVALMAIVAVISAYIYEHPNHHCPFCILKPEYGYYGYLLYIPLFLATAFGLGAGLLSHCRKHPSLDARLPALTRRLVAGSLIGFALFGAATLWAIWSSHLILFG